MTNTEEVAKLQELALEATQNLDLADKIRGIKTVQGFWTLITPIESLESTMRAQTMDPKERIWLRALKNHAVSYIREEAPRDLSDADIRYYEELIFAVKAAKDEDRFWHELYVLLGDENWGPEETSEFIFEAIEHLMGLDNGPRLISIMYLTV